MKMSPAGVIYLNGRTSLVTQNAPVT